MAQIAIPLVIVGALYLMSNEKETEGFEGTDVNAPEMLLRDKTKDFRNDYAKSKNAMNNEGTYSQYQDKYFLKNATQGDPLFNNVEEAKFVSLNGETKSNKEVSHNNMTVFYGSKSYGALPDSEFGRSTLDNYSGLGTLSIEKKEISPMFKPQTNIQNVYGNQNQNDFMQSRVNESWRKANTTPWAQVRDNKGEVGFNWAMADRDKSMPKNVDEMRTANNPKANYELCYQAPAYDPKAISLEMKPQDRMGKYVKKGPDTYHMNNSLQMMGTPGAASGQERPRIAPDQMLTDEQRDTTNVEYYGVRGVDDIGYTSKGEAGHVRRQQLKSDTVLNVANSTFNPVHGENYGKGGYKSYVNNRDNDTDYFGAIQGAFLANVVSPIVKTLKHTKKKDTDAPMTNLKGSAKSIVFNPKEHMPVTNREMNTEKIGFNHLSFERQQGTGYQVANPYLPATQRPSTSTEIYGHANGTDKFRSYGAEYNQRNIQKPYENRMPNGNAKEFQAERNFKSVDREQHHQYQTLGVRAGAPQVQFMGEQTKNVTAYQNIQEDYNNADLLKAFKSNPYTQPLGSFA
jgi:hypothetical protein